MQTKLYLDGVIISSSGSCKVTSLKRQRCALLCPMNITADCFVIARARITYSYLNLLPFKNFLEVDNYFCYYFSIKMQNCSQILTKLFPCLL